MKKRFIISESEKRRIRGLYGSLLFEADANSLEMPVVKVIDTETGELVLDASYGINEGNFKIMNQYEGIVVTDGKLLDSDYYFIIYENGTFKITTPYITIKDNKMNVPYGSVSEYLQKLKSFEGDTSLITDPSFKSLYELLTGTQLECLRLDERYMALSNEATLNPKSLNVYMKNDCGGDTDLIYYSVNDSTIRERTKGEKYFILSAYINGSNVQFQRATESVNKKSVVYVGQTPTDPINLGTPSTDNNTTTQTTSVPVTNDNSTTQTNTTPTIDNTTPDNTITPQTVDNTTTEAPPTTGSETTTPKDTEKIIDGTGRDTWDYKKITKADGTIEYYASNNNKKTWIKTKPDSEPYNAIKTNIFGD